MALWALHDHIWPGHLSQTLSSWPGQTRIPTFCWWQWPYTWSGVGSVGPLVKAESSNVRDAKKKKVLITFQDGELNNGSRKLNAIRSVEFEVQACSALLTICHCTQHLIILTIVNTGSNTIFFSGCYNKVIQSAEGRKPTSHSYVSSLDLCYLSIPKAMNAGLHVSIHARSRIINEVPMAWWCLSANHYDCGSYTGRV